LHCLVVEDQQILLDLLATIVDAFSEITTVSKATTCEQAIVISKDMPVDLAILDLHLPDGDGSELGLRLVQSNPSIQLVVLTGAPTV
jgi:response regulator of citrate/malate metabolism